MIYGKNIPLKDTLNPITLEILKNAFAAIPEEIGAALKRTAYSPNIKERRDASCAIFDAGGRTRRRVGLRMHISDKEKKKYFYKTVPIYC